MKKFMTTCPNCGKKTGETTNDPWFAPCGFELAEEANLIGHDCNAPDTFQPHPLTDADKKMRELNELSRETRTLLGL